ncbi:TetR/AcrR family transcriptional regulator [Brassicibacter mesophilus]|uniref:TetR/AcrR family transcriptional regulator n=1 Tax=Brassicibacter mesophilus TaxID=745119 RepID=UPI003D26237D
MPKIVNYDEKKHEIAENAVNVFIKNGYHKTKLSDIAKKCGMGRTTLYQYFENKDEIFSFVINHTSLEFKSYLEEVVNEREISFFDKIKKIINDLIRESSNNKQIIIMLELWLVLKMENAKIANEIRFNALELRRMFEYLLSESEKRGEIKKVNNEAMANTLYALVESLVLQQFLFSDLDAKQCISSIEILVEGLRI